MMNGKQKHDWPPASIPVRNQCCRNCGLRRKRPGNQLTPIYLVDGKWQALAPPDVPGCQASDRAAA